MPLLKELQVVSEAVTRFFFIVREEPKRKG